MQLKLRLDFGIPPSIKKEIRWGDDIERFPKLVTFRGKTYNLVSTSKDANNFTDYILLFSISEEIADPYASSIEGMFGNQFECWSTCCCGAIYDRHFPNWHTPMCPLWTRF